MHTIQVYSRDVYCHKEVCPDDYSHEEACPDAYCHEVFGLEV